MRTQNKSKSTRLIHDKDSISGHWEKNGLHVKSCKITIFYSIQKYSQITEEIKIMDTNMKKINHNNKI